MAALGGVKKTEFIVLKGTVSKKADEATRIQTEAAATHVELDKFAEKKGWVRASVDISAHGTPEDVAKFVAAVGGGYDVVSMNIVEEAVPEAAPAAPEPAAPPPPPPVAVPVQPAVVAAPPAAPAPPPLKKMSLDDIMSAYAQGSTVMAALGPGFQALPEDFRGRVSTTSKALADGIAELRQSQRDNSSQMVDLVFRMKVNPPLTALANLLAEQGLSDRV